MHNTLLHISVLLLRHFSQFGTKSMLNMSAK